MLLCPLSIQCRQDCGYALILSISVYSQLCIMHCHKCHFNSLHACTIPSSKSVHEQLLRTKSLHVTCEFKNKCLLHFNFISSSITIYTNNCTFLSKILTHQDRCHVTFSALLTSIVTQYTLEIACMAGRLL